MNEKDGSMKTPTWHYMTRAEVCAVRRVGRTHQYEDEKSGRFPPGERLGMRTIRWRSDVVAAWLEAESERAQGASKAIAARQSKSAKPGVIARRQKRLEKASSAELAGQA
jgi:predicted DNA-binding transcriptional regulator AlpA